MSALLKPVRKPLLKPLLKPLWRRQVVGVPAFSPHNLFAEGDAYGWTFVAADTVWADVDGTQPGVVNQTIRRLDDQRGDPWIGVTTGPTYRVAGDVHWLEFNQVDGRQLRITVPEITNGTLMIATRQGGVFSGNVNIPAGNYDVGRWDSLGIVGMLLIDRNLTQSERENVRQWFIAERGAGATFGGVTGFESILRELRLTSVDLFDTSSGTDFQGFLFLNILTTVPLFDTSSGTNFQSFLQNNDLSEVPLFDTSSGSNFNRFLRDNSLTTVPLFDTSGGINFTLFLGDNDLSEVPLFDTSSGSNFNMFLSDNPIENVPAGLFDNVKGTDFTDLFSNGSLTQQSVDNVLVSVATAANANNLNNGTLNLDSGTNATPSAAGQAAIDELVARGWTVTTN